MPEYLTETETRIIGSLIEKQLTTPEYYPLTMNALTAACNQKSNRSPVMSLGETELLAAIDILRDKNLVYLYYGSTSRTVKYKQMFDKVYELEPPAVAVMTLLMLRGPQTVGEIRGRADRLYEFSDLGEVQQTLDELSKLDEPLIVKLERQAGQKESRYADLLSGPIDEAALAESHGSPNSASSNSNERIEALERDIEELKKELTDIRQAFDEFKSQFG